MYFHENQVISSLAETKFSLKQWLKPSVWILTSTGNLMAFYLKRLSGMQEMIEIPDFLSKIHWLCDSFSEGFGKLRKLRFHLHRHLKICFLVIFGVVKARD